MAGKPQTYSQDPTNMMMAGVSPFASAYGQAKSTGWPYRGNPETEPGIPGPFDPPPEVRLRDDQTPGRAVPDLPGPRQGGPRVIPDPYVPPTPIPDLGYIPPWLQQYYGSGAGGGGGPGPIQFGDPTPPPVGTY